MNDMDECKAKIADLERQFSDVSMSEALKVAIFNNLTAIRTEIVELRKKENILLSRSIAPG